MVSVLKDPIDRQKRANVNKSMTADEVGMTRSQQGHMGGKGEVRGQADPQALSR